MVRFFCENDNAPRTTSMKIKQSPDDFQVDEVTDVVPSTGPFSLYRLEKTGWTTSDALNAIRRDWQIRIHRLSFGGLKDRHARTTQHLTIEAGPAQNLSQKGITLTYIGQVPEPFTSSAIRSNRFRIAVRDLSAEQVALAGHALGEVQADGVANYFDDQRFGSVEAGREFVARRAVLGDWEGALRLALTAPYEFDRGAVKQEKAILIRHWGDWSECARKLPRGDARALAAHLAADPGDYRGAFARIRAELGSLYLSAYQSHLWNAALADWLTRRLPESQRVGIRLKLDDVPTPRDLTVQQRNELTGWSYPLPSARLKYEELIPNTPPDWPDALRRSLAADGIDLEQMKLKGLRRPFFSRGERPILSIPTELGAESGPDERHPGRFKLVLNFILGRGSYATLVVKRVVQIKMIHHRDTE
jgi:tRNA pseudouridine13 synthase